LLFHPKSWHSRYRGCVWDMWTDLTREFSKWNGGSLSVFRVDQYLFTTLHPETLSVYASGSSGTFWPPCGRSSKLYLSWGKDRTNLASCLGTSFCHLICIFFVCLVTLKLRSVRSSSAEWRKASAAHYCCLSYHMEGPRDLRIC
jgi:hypothetical protein